MGCTTTHTDNSDFYEEKIDLQKEMYFFDNKWVPLQKREEIFKIKGEND